MTERRLYDLTEAPEERAAYFTGQTDRATKLPELKSKSKPKPKLGDIKTPGTVGVLDVEDYHPDTTCSSHRRARPAP